MIDDPLSPEEQSLVQQIQATSKPKLDVTARDEIRQRVVDEFRATINGQSQPKSIRTRFSIQRLIPLVAAAIIVVAIGLVIVQIGSQPINPIAETSSLTASPESQVAVASSATFVATVERETEVAIITPEITPIVTATTPPVTDLTPSCTPLAPTLTPTPEMVIIIEGPVTSIIDNTVTIYGFDIEVAPQHPILQVINVGDMVRVQGVMGSSGDVVANVVSNIPDTIQANGDIVTVGLDGPVEAINGNIVMVNSIAIQLAPDDPLLQTVQIGNFVSVQGNFQTSGSSVVLIVVNIVIINNTTVQSGCWYHDDGMGMGMGMGDDGMGMGMGR